MPVRSKKKWTPNSRGLYSRNIGQIEKKNGKTLPQRFYLGKDLTEAKLRNMRLEQLWQCIEIEHEKFGWPLLWNDLTLMIGMEISKGIYQIVVPRGSNHADAYARYINRLQNAFPMVSFIPEADEATTHQQGTEQARSVAMSSIRKRVAETRSGMEEKLLRSGGLTTNEIYAGEETLHEAFDSYLEEIKAIDVIPGTDTVTDGGNSKIRTVKRLKERQENVALSSLHTFDSVQAMINIWRSRPPVKNSHPPKAITKTTAQNHISELVRFLRWLNRTAFFEWRKPDNFDELETRVKETPQERKEKHNHTQVETYDINELKLLNEYATPIERLLLLLGLNCAFGAAEQGRLTLGDIHFNQQHPHAGLLKFESTPDDSFIFMGRPKTGVYGEWMLWKQTVDVIRWGRERREKLGDATSSAILLVTTRGTPMFNQTESGNRGQSFNRRWSSLTQRIQKDYHGFPNFSFGKLRKTAGNLVRQVSGGEVAGVFLCHGSPVKSDDLIDFYTNRPFAKVFDALKVLEEKLQPMFDAAPDLFSTQRFGEVKKQKRILELHDQGKTIRDIAAEVGLSKTTVRRHIQDLTQ